MQDLANELRRIPLLETVWKLPEGVGSRAFWWRQAPEKVLIRPFSRLVGPRIGANAEFPDSLSTHSGE